MQADLTGLIVMRDKINQDIALLQKANVTIDQSTVDNIKGDMEAIDTKIVAALTPVPSILDYTAFNMAVARLTENFATVKAGFPALTQATVDNLIPQIDALNSVLLGIEGIQ